MHYQRFDPTACGFPKPAVPILPSLGRQSLGRGSPSEFEPLGAGGNAQSFTRGRYALTEAYRLAGVGSDAAILLPAYHCRTMLDPAIRLGAPIVLYTLMSDLSPDMAALARGVAQSSRPVSAMLLTHYFGFAQSLRPIVDFCTQHSITLIEDCSHALFIHTDNANNATNTDLRMGQTGRYSVASPYKFFASQDGGLLWANASDAPRLTPQTGQPLTNQLKDIVYALQDIAVGAVPPPCTPADSALPATCGTDTLVQSAATSPYYQPAQEHYQSLACSRWVMRHTNIQRLVERRRRHYQQWATAVAGLPHCRALFAKLPADCVPYMFPLFIDHPDPHFFALKHLGMPIWRWDDMAVSGCVVATEYRLHLLHLPCHQELTPDQMAWMTSTVQHVLRQSPSGGDTS